MSDDIVTRLRAMVQWCENPKCEGCEVENEAIDEIERLRYERDRYREMSDNYLKCLDIYSKKKWWQR